MTQYLTAQQVLFIHARLIEMTGGEHGLRDLNALASAVARPEATFEGHELYPDPFTKAAALMESLTLDPSFVDGNKRTNVAVAALFLGANGWRLNAGDEELARFTSYVADEWPPLDEIADWFREHAIGEP
jgi:death-on-curing protein